MKLNRGFKVQFLAVFLFLIIFLPSKVGAWDTNVGHPEIVNLGVEVYNQNSDQKVTTEQLGWLKQGAMQEDTPLRWFNHFYDPVRNIGFKGMWSKSIDWTIDSKKQRDYAMGDRSWYRAIDQYQNENYEEAFKSLGHVLHLLADTSVPAHTRDDSHPEGDSLEQFVKYNWEEIKKYLSQGEFKQVGDLHDAFYDSAVQTNSGFYSDDTIESEVYKKLEIEDYEEFEIENEKFYFAKPSDGKKLFYTKTKSRWEIDSEKSLKNHQILLDYTKKLIPQASGYTAGVVKLFFEEVQKEQEVELSKNAKEGILGWFNRRVGNVISIGKELFGNDDFYNPVMMPVGAEEGEEISSQDSERDPSVPQDDSGEESVATPPSLPLERGGTQEVATPPHTSSLRGEPSLPLERGGTDPATTTSNYEVVLVQRIIDGDTFEIEIDGKKQSVRIIGIDTPEKKRCFFEESKVKAEELLFNEKVRLVKDDILGDKDQYGRLLRYVYREKDDLFFNKTMIEQGFAKEYNFKGQGYKFVYEFEIAERLAELQKFGLWFECYKKDEPVVVATTTLLLDTASPTSTIPVEDLTGQATTSYKYSGGGSSSSSSSGGSSSSGDDSGGDDVDDGDEEILNQVQDDNNIDSPTLDSHFDNTIYTNTTTIEILGITPTNTEKLFYYHTTSTESMCIYIELSIDINSSSFSWNKNFDLTNGHNYFYFQSQDLEGNTSTLSNPAHIIFDTEVPSIPELQIQNNSGFNSQELLITASSTDDFSENLFYDLNYSTNTLDWILYQENSPTGIFSFFGERGIEYYFRSQAEDQAENISDWSESTTTSAKIAWNQDVVINEIDWSGARGDWDAEWIEFYNNTDEDINLTGWSMNFSGKVTNFVAMMDPIIPAHGYFLTERTTDRSVIRMDANSLHNGILNNNGEKVLLKNSSGEITDEVDCSGGWFAGDSTGMYSSMERINSLVSGNNQSNWKSSEGDRKAGEGYSGSLEIYGSPKTSNLGNIVLTNAQQEDLRVLTKNNNPYILGNYAIPVDKILQIESGVVVKSDYNKAIIKVEGELKILGTEEEKVIMTSGRDVSLESGQEKIGDYEDGDPGQEDWIGFVFENGSSGEIAGLDFRYAGYMSWSGTFVIGAPVYKAIIVDNANVEISNSRFYQTGGTAINSANSNLTISSSEFDGGVHSIYAKNSNLILNDLVVENYTSSDRLIEIYDNFPEMSNLTLENNTNNRIQLGAMVLTEDRTLAGGNQYLITGLEVASGAVLTMEAGVDIQMHNKGVIKVNGNLQANGTAGEKINIHAMDTSTTWGHIEFNNSNSKLEHVSFYDGNHHYPSYASNNGMVIANNSTVSFSDCIFKDIFSTGNIIRSRSSNLNFSNCQIGETEKYDSDAMTSPNYTEGIDLKDGGLVLDNVEFVNLNVGVFGNGTDGGIPPQVDFSSSIFNNVDYNHLPNPWINLSE